MESGHRTYLFAHGVARRIDDVPTAAVRNSREAVKWSSNFAYAVSNQPLYGNKSAIQCYSHRTRKTFEQPAALKRPAPGSMH